MAAEGNRGLAGLPGGMLQFDVILPTQQFDQRYRQPPEQRLMVAVLQDALDCLVKYRQATDILGQRLFEEAVLWFRTSESTWPYSFEGICSVLDLDADAVRERLLTTLKTQAH